MNFACLSDLTLYWGVFFCLVAIFIGLVSGAVWHYYQAFKDFRENAPAIIGAFVLVIIAWVVLAGIFQLLAEIPTCTIG